MTPNAEARAGYGAAAAPIRTARGAEYAVFARVTGNLRAVEETDKRAYPQLAQAVIDNQRLWSTLAEDLMLETNVLPVALRAQLISLAEFVRRHSLSVLRGQGKVAALIDINTAIMRGLRGEVEAAA
ncbi:MAG: flagellar biosynthesis regulator FlaF [Amaricoccus sp.]